MSRPLLPPLHNIRDGIVFYTKVDTYRFELTVTGKVTVMTQCLATRDQWNRNSDNVNTYTTYKNCSCFYQK